MRVLALDKRKLSASLQAWTISRQSESEPKQSYDLCDSCCLTDNQIRPMQTAFNSLQPESMDHRV